MSHRGRKDRRPSQQPVAAREVALELAPTSDTATVWRCEFLAPDGYRRISGFTGEYVHDRVVDAACARGDHEPPGVDCSCGIYGVRRAEDLALFMKTVEYNRAWKILRGESDGLEYVRIMLVRGELANPVPVVSSTQHHIVPRWGANPMAKRPLSLDIKGDPPGTLRGSRFTLTGPVVVQTTPDDPEDVIRDTFDGLECHLLPEIGAESLLSRRLERHGTRRRRSEHEWWTA